MRREGVRAGLGGGGKETNTKTGRGYWEVYLPRSSLCYEATEGLRGRNQSAFFSLTAWPDPKSG